MIKNLLLLLFFVSSVLMAEPTIEILVSAEEIRNQNPDDFFVDGKVDAYINDDQLIDRLEYSYTANTPPVACGFDSQCAEYNAQFMNKPTMTFEIIINDAQRIDVSYFCDAIGIIKSSYTEGMPDLFCGPSYKLKWNGSEYLLVEDEKIE